MSPVFFRNGEQINVQLINGILTIVLNRTIEGGYSCGEKLDGRIIKDESDKGVVELIRE